MRRNGAEEREDTLNKRRAIGGKREEVLIRPLSMNREVTETSHLLPERNYKVQAALFRLGHCPW
jgi:hypothetical protein